MLNIFSVQNQNNGLVGGSDHGVPLSSPMFNDRDTINSSSAPFLIQDSALSGINFTNLSADNIQGGTINASQIFIGNGAFSVDATGFVKATKGQIAGWEIINNTFESQNNHIVLDSGNNRFEMSDGTNIRVLFQT